MECMCSVCELQTKNCQSCDKQILAVAVVRVLTHLLSESSVCKVQSVSAFIDHPGGL